MLANRACKPLSRRYTDSVAETTANQIGVWNCIGGQPPVGGIFSSAATSAPSMVGPWQGSACARRFPMHRYANPVMRPATPIGVGGRVNQPSIGGRTCAAPPLVLSTRNPLLSKSSIAPCVKPQPLRPCSTHSTPAAMPCAASLKLLMRRRAMLELVQGGSASTPKRRAMRRGQAHGTVTAIEHDETHPRLIATLESLLAQARAGEISGMVAALVDPEGACTYLLSGAAAASPAVAADIASRLNAKIASRLAWTDSQAVDR